MGWLKSIDWCSKRNSQIVHSEIYHPVIPKFVLKIFRRLSLPPFVENSNLAELWQLELHTFQIPGNYLVLPALLYQQFPLLQILNNLHLTQDLLNLMQMILDSEVILQSRKHVYLFYLYVGFESLLIFCSVLLFVQMLCIQH